MNTNLSTAHLFVAHIHTYTHNHKYMVIAYSSRTDAEQSRVSWIVVLPFWFWHCHGCTLRSINCHLSFVRFFAIREYKCSFILCSLVYIRANYHYHQHNNEMKQWKFNGPFKSHICQCEMIHALIILLFIKAFCIRLCIEAILMRHFALQQIVRGIKHSLIFDAIKQTTREHFNLPCTPTTTQIIRKMPTLNRIECMCM